MPTVSRAPMPVSRSGPTTNATASSTSPSTANGCSALRQNHTS